MGGRSSRNVSCCGAAVSPPRISSPAWAVLLRFWLPRRSSRLSLSLSPSLWLSLSPSPGLAVSGRPHPVPSQRTRRLRRLLPPDKTTAQEEGKGKATPWSRPSPPRAAAPHTPTPLQHLLPAHPPCIPPSPPTRAGSRAGPRGSTGVSLLPPAPAGAAPALPCPAAGAAPVVRGGRVPPAGPGAVRGRGPVLPAGASCAGRGGPEGAADRQRPPRSTLLGGGWRGCCQPEGPPDPPAFPLARSPPPRCPRPRPRAACETRQGGRAPSSSRAPAFGCPQPPGRRSSKSSTAGQGRRDEPRRVFPVRRCGREPEPGKAPGERLDAPLVREVLRKSARPRRASPCCREGSARGAAGAGSAGGFGRLGGAGSQPPATGTPSKAPIDPPALPRSTRRLTVLLLRRQNHHQEQVFSFRRIIVEYYETISTEEEKVAMCDTVCHQCCSLSSTSLVLAGPRSPSREART